LACDDGQETDRPRSGPRDEAGGDGAEGDDERREIDLEQLRYRYRLAWMRAIDAEIARFRLGVNRERAERNGDAAMLASLDQLTAEVLAEWKKARRRFRRLRRELRRLCPDDPIM
jgi:hypothetical protein